MSIFTSFVAVLGSRSHRLRQLTTCIFAALLLQGCTSTSQPPAKGLPATAPAVEPATKPEEISYGNFSEDELTRAILAELAGQRGQGETALAGYLTLARENHNLSIIQRALRIAEFSRNDEAIMEMAQAWLEQEPAAVEPRQAMAVEFLTQGRYRDAFQQFALLQDQGENIDFRLVSARIASVATRGLPPLGGLLEDYEALLKKHPQQESLRLSLAHLYQLDKQPKSALTLIRQLQKEVELREKGQDAPGVPTVKGGDLVMLEVQILDGLDDKNAAQKRLLQGIRSYPEHKELRYLLGRKLIADKKFNEAREQFAALVQQNPNDADLLYSLSLLSMEVHMYAEAKSYLQRLLSTGQRLDDTHFHLGNIDSQENRNELAIDHYMKVRSGSNFMQAQRSLSQLMVRSNRYDELHTHLQNLRFRNADLNIPLLAMEANVLIEEKKYDAAGVLLNSSVGAFPTNVDLLFLRSVLSGEVNDLPLMESDLRKIMQLQPQSPVAYNSLGYTLADRTDRLQEAYDLIKRAYELSPNDPAIIDSLGWVQYKVGMYKEARENLEKAYKLFPDAEVAAHLGEVLWKLGEKSAASKLWRGALATQPDNQPLRNTMQRLDPSSTTR